MTKVIKINCNKLQKILICLSWFGLSLLPVYGVYIQVETLNTFTDDGDCHIAYFDKEYMCISIFEKMPWAYPNYSGVLSFEDVSNYITFFIVVEIIIQVIGFLILNNRKKWLVLECAQQNNEGVSSD